MTAQKRAEISSDAFGDIFDSAMDAFVGINQGAESAVYLTCWRLRASVGKVLKP